MKIYTKTYREGTPFERETYIVETYSGKFEIDESMDGGLVVSIGGPSALQIEGANTHSGWKLSADKTIVLYRTFRGEPKKLTDEQRREIREGWNEHKETD